MRRFRRLLIASQPIDAGVPHHVLDLLDAVPLDAWAVDVACPRSSLLWNRLAGRPGITLHELSPQRGPSLGDLRSLIRLVRLVGRADVSHGHSSKAGFLLRLAAAIRRRGALCIFTPHGWSFWVAQGATERVYVALERLAARWCAAIVAVSDAERDAGARERIGRPSQYRVIPNGVDLAKFGAEPSPMPGRIVIVGRLARPKRPDLVVRALGRVLESHAEAELHVVGDGPLRPELELLVGELGLGESVRLLGAREDVERVLRDAACVVLASDWEACPFSVIEAMAAAVPVVATAVGGVPELVEHQGTGLLVPPGNDAALAAALVELLDDPARAASFGERGRIVAHERLSRERMTAQVLALYDEIDRR